MPTYVYSGAAGANDGTSWTDAYTSIASAVGVAAGTEIWIASDHSQNAGASLTLTFTNGTRTNPVKVLSVARADDTLAAGASITTGAGSGRSLTINGNVVWHGVTLEADRLINLANTNTSDRQEYEDCAFQWPSGAASKVTGLMLGRAVASTNIVAIRGGTVNFSNANSTGVAVNFLCADIDLSNIAFTWKTSQSNFAVFNAGQWSRATVSYCDLSGAPSTVGAWVDGLFLLTFECCNVPSGWLTGGMSGSPSNGSQHVTLWSCGNGTITVPPLGLTRKDTLWGGMGSSLSRYRTGGADDGEQANAHSWEMTTNANALELYNGLESPPIVRWLAAGSQTVTIYVASGVTLQDDEFWVDIEYQGEGGTPTAQATSSSSRADPRATPANLTSDGVSTWNGTGVGTAQKIDIAINPAVAGHVSIRCFLAKPSTTVYVDPRPEVA